MASSSTRLLELAAEGSDARAHDATRAAALTGRVGESQGRAAVGESRFGLRARLDGGDEMVELGAVRM